MSKTLQKLALFALLAGLSLAVSGCLEKPESVVNTNADTNQNINQNQNVNQNTNTNVNSDEIDTSGWKTYRNEEYGFEFRYPKEWKFQLYGGPDPELNFGISFINLLKIEGVNIEVRDSLINKAVHRFCFYATPLDHGHYLQLSCRENNDNNLSILDTLLASLKINNVLIDAGKIQISPYYIDNEFISVIIPEDWTFFSSYTSSVKGSTGYDILYIDKIFKNEDSNSNKRLSLEILTYEGDIDTLKEGLTNSELLDPFKLVITDDKEFSVFTIVYVSSFDSSRTKSYHIILTGKSENVLINIFSTEDFEDIASDIKTVLSTIVVK